MDGASNYWIARKTLDIINHISPEAIIIQWSYIHRAELNDTTLSDENRRLHFAHCEEYLYENIELGYRFVKLIQQVELVKQQTRIIHSFIPEFGIKNDVLNIWNQISDSDWPPFPQSLEEFNGLPSNIVDELINFFKVYDIFKIYYGVHHKIEYVSEIKKLDLARDGLHYDILTAQQFATSVRELLNGNC